LQSHFNSKHDWLEQQTSEKQKKIIKSAIDTGYPQYALPLQDELDRSSNGEESLPDSEFLLESNDRTQREEELEGEAVEQPAKKTSKKKKTYSK
jgi:hypothetical protein